MSIKVGDPIPTDTKLVYVPYTPASADINACGIPLPVNIAQEWANQLVVVVSVPGAFTPTCATYHIPPFLQLYEDFKGKGVDTLAVIAANDPFVMSAWGKASNAQDKILFMSDPNAQFSKSIGWSLDLTQKGLGVRTGRYAIVYDHGKVSYAEIESNPSAHPTVSSAKTVLSKL